MHFVVFFLNELLWVHDLKIRCVSFSWTDHEQDVMMFDNIFQCLNLIKNENSLIFLFSCSILTYEQLQIRRSSTGEPAAVLSLSTLTVGLTSLTVFGVFKHLQASSHSRLE